MYRHDRIGPFPRFDLANGVYAFTNPFTPLAVTVPYQPTVFIPEATVEEYWDELNVQTNSPQSLPATDYFFLGIALLTNHPEPVMQYGVQGQCWAKGNSIENVRVFPFVGLLNGTAVTVSQTVANNPMDEYMILPTISQEGGARVANDHGHGSCSVNTRVLIEATVESAQLVVAGFCVANMAIASANAIDLVCGLSFQKYARDENVFDPPRG